MILRTRFPAPRVSLLDHFVVDVDNRSMRRISGLWWILMVGCVLPLAGDGCSSGTKASSRDAAGNADGPTGSGGMGSGGAGAGTMLFWGQTDHLRAARSRPRRPSVHAEP